MVQAHVRAHLRGVVLLTALGVAAVAAPLRAQQQTEVDELKRQMQELMRANAQQQKQIEQLQKQVEKLSAEPGPRPSQTPSAVAAAAPTPSAGAESEIDKALAEVRPPTTVEQPAGVSAAATEGGLLTQRVGGAQLRLIDVSFDILAAAGSSSVGGETLMELEGGAHDPNRRGFTLQQGELSLAGAVDPYFIGEAHVVFTDSEIDLEEAFFVTTALPYDLQVRGGYFFTDFGRINPTHPHAWTYLDQPFIITRMFGGEGMRAPGLQVNWLAPLPWFSELSVAMQDGDEGDLTISFLNDDGGIGGRPAVDTGVHNLSDFAYLTRWANSWDITPEITALVGVSGVFGANATGPGADTYVYGTDLTFKWRPAQNFRGWPFVVWQSEALDRYYTADAFTASDPSGPFPNDLPRSILRDYGFYSQVLWGFTYPWAVALRAEYATGNGKSVMDGELVSRETDPFRCDRFRLTPLLIYHLSEFSRLRLQFDYDEARFLPGNHDAYSGWLGIEVLYGTHAAHKY